MNESIVNTWMFIRYLVIGLYVGVVTVSGYAWWYLWNPEGPQISWTELTHFDECVEGKMPYR
jgi:Ca2+ transporting ATPase